jgi:hypothetical protein
MCKSTQNNIINNNTTFKDQLEVEFATTSIYNAYLYKYTEGLRIQIRGNNIEWY